MKPKRIIKHETYIGMYRLEYARGVVSDNFWNISRANDILKHYDEYVRRENVSDQMKRYHEDTGNKPVRARNEHGRYIGSQL